MSMRPMPRSLRLGLALRVVIVFEGVTGTNCKIFVATGLMQLVDSVIRHAGTPGGVCERLVGEGICRVGQAAGRKVAKVTAALRSRRKFGPAGDGLRTVSQALIGAKHEDLILSDGPARGSAELILLLRGDAIREEVARVECVIAHKFTRRAMKLVSLGLRHEGYARVWVAAVCGGENRRWRRISV